MDVNGYLHVRFFDIHTLHVTYRVRNLDINKLLIGVQVCVFEERERERERESNKLWNYNFISILKYVYIISH